jgi:hypothetical protein
MLCGCSASLRCDAQPALGKQILDSLKSARGTNLEYELVDLAIDPARREVPFNPGLADSRCAAKQLVRLAVTELQPESRAYLFRRR